jgi:hypothetical protein
MVWNRRPRGEDRDHLRVGIRGAAVSEETEFGIAALGGYTRSDAAPNIGRPDEPYSDVPGLEIRIPRHGHRCKAKRTVRSPNPRAHQTEYPDLCPLLLRAFDY